MPCSGEAAATSELLEMKQGEPRSLVMGLQGGDVCEQGPCKAPCGCGWGDGTPKPQEKQRGLPCIPGPCWRGDPVVPSCRWLDVVGSITSGCFPTSRPSCHAGDRSVTSMRAPGHHGAPGCCLTKWSMMPVWEEATNLRDAGCGLGRCRGLLATLH